MMVPLQVGTIMRRSPVGMAVLDEAFRCLLAQERFRRLSHDCFSVFLFLRAEPGQTWTCPQEDAGSNRFPVFYFHLQI